MIRTGWWRWALVGPDGVVPSRTVRMSASVNLSLHHKVQKFYSGNDHLDNDYTASCSLQLL